MTIAKLVGFMVFPLMLLTGPVLHGYTANAVTLDGVEMTSLLVDPETNVLRVSLLGTSEVPITAWKVSAMLSFTNGFRAKPSIAADYWVQYSHPGGPDETLASRNGVWFSGQTRDFEFSLDRGSPQAVLDTVTFSVDALVFADQSWVGSSHAVTRVITSRQTHQQETQRWLDRLQNLRTEQGDNEACRTLTQELKAAATSGLPTGRGVRDTLAENFQRITARSDPKPMLTLYVEQLQRETVLAYIHSQLRERTKQ